MSLISVNKAAKYFRGRKQRMTVREHIQDAVKGSAGEGAFCALRGITFTVEEGESVAFVGANGAGKSTLLSLVCGLAKPDEGTVEVRSTIAPLLELGSGFHPDLTGKENIYMNAALLGMTEAQVVASFDRIAGFSELGDAIAEPVRVYSAGMVMRLAFSIAVHCDAALYVIDEVLGVGDAAFSVKCLNKIRELRAAGKTLLFVSHNPGSVTEFCDRAIWLHEGEIVMDGPASKVMKHYMEFMAQPGSGLSALGRIRSGRATGRGEAAELAGKGSRGQR